MGKAVRAVWNDRCIYTSRRIAWNNTFKRYESRFRSKFLFGLEGATVDSSTIAFIHKEEGNMLSMMTWRAKREEEGWAVFMSR
eukprot:9159862-Pyramimonas_sp.AAC.1